jgi:signal transduction histidine kinase
VPVKGDVDYLKEAAIGVLHFVLRQPGTQAITVKVASSGDASRMMIIGDGETVDAEDREKIFEPYARSSSKQAPLGHGLGLALAKLVVELHGGSIWVEDAPKGGGSAFILELQPEGSPRLRTVE